MSNSLEFWGGLSPFRAQSPLGRLVDDFFVASDQAAPARFAPLADVKENKEAFLLSFDVPGLSKDAIKIHLEDDTLTVSGERNLAKKEDETKVHVAEVAYGTFSRAFRFPTAVDAERTEASYENGVLTVKVAKAATVQPRQISVR